MKLTDKLKDKSESKKDAKELIKETDMELSNDDLENVSGGLESFNDIDPNCGMTVMS